MKRFAGALIGIAVAVLVCLLISQRFHFLESLEYRLLDLRFRLRGELDTTGQVALVAIDADSVDAYGRWPWPRETMAELLRKICEAEPAAVGLDIVFSEPQEETWRETLRHALEAAPPGQRPEQAMRALESPTGDEQLAAAIAECADRLVLGYYFLEEGSRTITGEGSPDNILASSVTLVTGNPDLLNLPGEGEPPGVETNIDILAAQARYRGYFNMRNDEDGIVRRYHLVAPYDLGVYPALAVETARVAAGAPMLRLEIEDIQKERETSLTLGDLTVSCDHRARLLVDWRGGPKTFTHHSAAKILSGEIGKKDLAGKALLVGVTETGVKDIRPVPVGKIFPGTEIHANVVDGILGGHYLRRSGNQLMVDLLTVLGIGIVLGQLLSWLRKAHTMLLVTIAVAAVVFTANYLVFRRLGTWVNLVYPLIAIAGVYVAEALYRTMVVERKAKQVRAVFEKYVDHSVVNEVLKHPEAAVLGGTRRELTILFSDIRGFTRISEQMDPESVVKFLNAYLTPMTDIVLRHRGTLDKYMGDAIMAFWNAPLEDPDHAADACRAALDMGRALEKIRTESGAKGTDQMEIGIGLNTGIGSVGNMGSEQIYDYTVIGDAVNLASRLEGANKNYGTRIILSESTWEKVKSDGFVARELDRVRVKGKAQPVTIFELVGHGDEELPLSPRFLKLFAEGLQGYYSQRFDEALKAFHAALVEGPGDQPTIIYTNRCETFRAEPPLPDWDGVFTMTVK